MSDYSEAATPRREFLGQIAASAIVLAGTACAVPASTAQSAPSPMPSAPPAGEPATTPVAPMHWDDSWFGRLTAKHKAVFDSPEISEGLTLGPSHAARYLNGMREAIGAAGSDVQAVVVLRHRAIPFAFNDAMWAKYAIGEEYKIKTGDKWATANPLAAGRTSSARPNANAGADRPQGNLAWLASHGHILLGCDLATNGLASGIAERVKGNARAIHEELRANVVPGMILQPNGIYATMRAQEAGCVYMRSS